MRSTRVSHNCLVSLIFHFHGFIGVVIARGEGAQIAEKGDEAEAEKDIVEETGEAGVMTNTRSVHLSEEEVIAGNGKEEVEEIVAPVQVHSNSQGLLLQARNRPFGSFWNLVNNIY